MTTIKDTKIKYGSTMPTSDDLDAYSLGYNVLDNSLYIGLKTGNPIKLNVGEVSKEYAESIRLDLNNEVLRATNKENILESSMVALSGHQFVDGLKEFLVNPEAPIITDLSDSTKKIANTDFVQKLIASLIIAAPIWIKSVDTVENLPAIEDENTYLCRVRNLQQIWQYIFTTGWSFYSDHSEFVNEQELTAAILIESIRAEAAESNLNTKIDELHTGVGYHITSIANPHFVTKAQIGLPNVDNTSDVNKPVSTAQLTAIETYSNAVQYNLDIEIARASLAESELILNTVKKTNDETIDGIKTFIKSPFVPTEDIVDTSTKIANTEFVHNIFEIESKRIDALELRYEDSLPYTIIEQW